MHKEHGELSLNNKETERSLTFMPYMHVLRNVIPVYYHSNNI